MLWQQLHGNPAIYMHDAWQQLHGNPSVYVYIYKRCSRNNCMATKVFVYINDVLVTVAWQPSCLYA